MQYRRLRHRAGVERGWTYRVGDTADARVRVARLRLDEPDSSEAGVHQAAAWASLLVGAGETARAIAFLNRSPVPRPKFDPLRGAAVPAVADLLERAGVSAPGSRLLRQPRGRDGGAIPSGSPACQEMTLQVSTPFGL